MPQFLNRWPLTAAMLVVVLLSPPSRAEESYSYRPFDISLVSPVNIFHPPRKAIVGLSLNLLHGRSTAMFGIEAGGGYNSVEELMVGIQVAGFLNRVGGRAYGLQISAIGNRAAGGGGLQLAALSNMSDPEATFDPTEEGAAYHGLQLSLLINNAGPLRGFQLAPINYSRKIWGGQLGAITWAGEVRGLQLGMLAMAGDLAGVQLSGWNWATERLRGLQIGAQNFAWGQQDNRVAQVGLVNYLSDGRAVQLGLVNIGRRITGLQLGLINVCRTLRGLQLGLVNVVSRGKLPFMPVANMGW